MYVQLAIINVFNKLSCEHSSFPLFSLEILEHPPKDNLYKGKRAPRGRVEKKLHRHYQVVNKAGMGPTRFCMWKVTNTTNVAHCLEIGGPMSYPDNDANRHPNPPQF